MLVSGLLPWIVFNFFILVVLVFDLAVLHRKSEEPSFRDAMSWTGVWIGLALIFNLGILYYAGSEKAVQFLTAYLVEESLSVDNLFVFLLVFSHFRVPRELQRGVLFWGILGALLMRLSFILAGVALLERFHWLIYVFGAILVISGIRLWGTHEREIHPEKNPILRLFRRFVPITPDYRGASFWVREAGKWMATPLAVVLIVIETTDVIFAVDSIPAVLAISKDPFIVYSSNAFAILGLRSLYFALAGLMRLFHYLHYGLAAVLIFVGLKMVLSEWVKISALASLGVIIVVLGVAVVASLRSAKRANLDAPGSAA
ncbi:MAG TPA: TerC family protein, partial [Candidatus Eisenbacteria bacterium]|nr:TerC family protein [Candidatus Eisenbacteria bacterium]